MLELLLRYGLDPNALVDGDNIMDSVRYVDNKLLAADALALLLKHGSNVNLYIPECGESVFQAVDFDVWYGDRLFYQPAKFNASVYCWMVLVGYGA